MFSQDDFESFYFGTTLQTYPDYADLDLGEIREGDSIEFRFVNNRHSTQTLSILIDDLEEESFTVTYGGVGFPTKASLNPMDGIGPFEEYSFTVNFLNSPRDPVQATNVQAQELAVPIVFDRQVLIERRPQVSAREEIQFLTDITEAWDGTEQRIRTRPFPRSLVTYKYLGDSTVRNDQLADIYGLPGRAANVPMWHRLQKIVNVVDGGGSFFTITLEDSGSPFPVDPSIRALEAGDKLTYFSVANGIIKAADILTVNPTSILISFPGEVPQIGDYVLPTEHAHMNEQPKVSIWPTRASEANVAWLVERLAVLPGDLGEDPGNPPDGYAALAPDLCDFDTTRPILREGYIDPRLDIESQSKNIRFDERIGSMAVFNRRNVPTISFSKIFEYTHDYQSVYDFRRFITWTWGRQKSFFVTTELEELLYDLYPGGDQLTVFIGDMGNYVDFEDSLAGIDIRLTVPGTYDQYQILDYLFNPSDGKLTMTLDRTFTTNTGNIQAISLLHRVRLASDRIVINYTDRDSISCRLRFVGVKA